MFGCITQRGENIRVFKVGVVFENFLMGRTSCQKAEHILDADAHAANARFSTAFPRLDSDSVQQVGVHFAYSLECRLIIPSSS